MSTTSASDCAEELQFAIDSIFAEGTDHIGNCQFSVTIADPILKDCPLVGCSTGFTRLCGYEMDEIVGRNCRFLVDPVPEQYRDDVTRRRTREFIQSRALADP